MTRHSPNQTMPMVASSNQQEKIMNKTTTHKDSLDVCADLPLEDYELDSVSGGTPAQDAMDNKKQAEALKVFQQLLQELP
jgi:hypothetical protein